MQTNFMNFMNKNRRYPDKNLSHSRYNKYFILDILDIFVFHMHSVHSSAFKFPINAQNPHLVIILYYSFVFKKKILRNF